MEYPSFNELRTYIVGASTYPAPYLLLRPSKKKKKQAEYIFILFYFSMAFSDALKSVPGLEQEIGM